MEEDKIAMHKKLLDIQQALEAPKGQFNSFGNYKYRSCEDILDAVKPLLKKHELTLILADEVINLGDRYYVKATAYLSSYKTTISNTAYARESLDKKGMDDSQITGSTSSYARKYALNGLFAIDDVKDADTMDNTKVATKTPTTTLAPASDTIAFGKHAGKKWEDIPADYLTWLISSEQTKPEVREKAVRTLESKKPTSSGEETPPDPTDIF